MGGSNLFIGANRSSIANQGGVMASLASSLLIRRAY